MSAKPKHMPQWGTGPQLTGADARKVLEALCQDDERTSIVDKLAISRLLEDGQAIAAECERLRLRAKVDRWAIRLAYVLVPVSLAIAAWGMS